MPIQKQMLLLSAFAAVALPGAQSSHAADSSVTVMYAGSLVNLMQQGIAKAFDTASGDHVQGYAAGSNELAGDIKGKTRHADVFISANPELNKTMMGSANGDWETWYVTFAESPLVSATIPTAASPRT